MLHPVVASAGMVQTSAPASARVTPATAASTPSICKASAVTSRLASVTRVIVLCLQPLVEPLHVAHLVVLLAVAGVPVLTVLTVVPEVTVSPAPVPAPASGTVEAPPDAAPYSQDQGSEAPSGVGKKLKNSVLPVVPTPCSYRRIFDTAREILYLITISKTSCIKFGSRHF